MKEPCANLDTRTIDEQIEEILHTFTDQRPGEDARFLQDLQYLYRKDHILARARARVLLADADQPASTHMRDEQATSTNAIWQEQNTIISQPSTPEGRKTPAWSKIAAVLAAVLLLGALIGTTQFFHAHPQQTAGNKDSQTITTVTPISTVLFSDPLKMNLHNWQVDGQTYFFQDSAYHVFVHSYSAAAILPERTFAPPWSYTLTMAQLQGNVTSPVNTFGVVFDFTSMNGIIRFSTCEFRNENGNSQINCYHYDSSNVKVTPWTPLGVVVSQTSTQAFHPGLGVANTMQVRATASGFTLFANGQTVGTANVSIGSGQIGMYVNLKGSEIAFQNLLVTRP